MWHKRQNKTMRPTLRLKPQEEAMALVDLREYRVKEERVSQAVVVFGCKGVGGGDVEKGRGECVCKCLW